MLTVSVLISSVGLWSIYTIFDWTKADAWTEKNERGFLQQSNFLNYSSLSLNGTSSKV